MAENTVVAATVKLDTSLAAKQMSDLNKIIAEQKKIWKDAEIGSKEYQEAQKKLGEAQTEYNKLAEESGGGAKKQSEAFGVLKDKIGGLVPGLKGAESGVKSFGSELKILAANPVMLILTAIVLALTFVYEAFKNTGEGAKKTEQVMAGLKATLGVLMDTVFALGRAWLDSAKALFSVYEAAYKFITLDFKGAGKAIDEAKEHAKDAVKDVKEAGDKFADAASGRTATTVANATKALQGIAKEERLDAEDKAKRAKDLALLREKLNDESVPLAEKKKAAKELRDEEIKNAADDLDRQKRKVAQKLILLTVEKDGEIKNADEISELKRSIAETEKENALEGVRTNKVIRNLEKQEKAEQAAANKEAADKKKEAAQNFREFTQKDLKIQQEIELAAITDAKTKELKVIENSLKEELSQNEQSLKEGKLKKEQYLKLNQDAKELARVKSEDVETKYTKKFEEDLNKIRLETQTAGIEDARQKERKLLESTFAERYKQAEEAYKNDAKKLAQIKEALTHQQRISEKALEKKFDAEDAKKKQELDLKEIDNELKNKKLAFKIQRDLLNEKEKIQKAAFAEEIKAANGNALKLRDIQIRQTQSENENKEARKKIKKEEVDATVQAADAIADVLLQSSKLIGEQTAVGKAMAVISATISTITSAQKAFERGMEIPYVGPVLAPIYAGLAVATGVANVQKILSVEVPGASGGGGSVSAPSAPIAPTQTSTALNAKSIQGVGNAAAQGVGRTFVLDSDIKSSGEREKRLTRAARLA